MKKFLLFLAFLILFIVGFFGYTFYSTGYFREVNAVNNFGPTYAELELPGVEDMALARADSLVILSVDDRAKRRQGESGLHGLYLIDLKEEKLQALELTKDLPFPLFPHGISIYPLDSGTYRLMVINHVDGKHSVESFLLSGKTLQHIETITGPELMSPNDLVLVSPEAFYYSNDHGSKSSLGIFAENYLGAKLANVGYYDGESFRIVAEDLAYPNGLAYDKNQDLLYVASSRGFLVRVFSVTEDGSLEKLEDIKTQTGVDNIELDENEKLWIGCHPNLITFAAYASGKKEISPSEIITIDYQKGQAPQQEIIWTDPGSQMSASSVALPFGDFLFLGNVMDEKMLILKKN
ncbi:arylesterase [Algoriphagus boseongensis]|uniref:Arylesterase n=1 Tax=Algoriphagus boseongensis TaxID=1442587 RepID=A0A4R6T4Q3_9BACT|nr:SMP-30/gluconolactonase/LRE family protein [Algoriphagus boseongensis]TDQ17481.1 arylesterase [Algoriphagus boseongensis]